jgi:hypothetical protein
MSNDEILAFDSFEFALFINGFDIERKETLFDTYNNETIIGQTIKFLSDTLFIDIVTKFTKFLNTKENEENIYCSSSLSKNCKIPSNLDNIDKQNLESIFNIKFIKDKQAASTIKQTDNSIYIEDNNETNGFVLFNENTNYKFPFEYKDKINIINNLKKINIMYFANPLIKYIYFILNYLYIKLLNNNERIQPEMSHTVSQIFYRSATFFIYKYINFIVNQGRSIVTNLEHLKFFFLTRTGAIKKYNEDKEKKETNTSFICSDRGACSDIIINSKIYKNTTPVGKLGVNIDERINFGNMKTYGLIDILQKLSSSPLLDECKKTDGNLNLLEYQNKTDSNSKNALLGAIFIMFTNYKIFLDNEIDSQDITVAKNKLDTLCKAAIDTANFTQSISSTSINKKPETKFEEIQPGYKNIKDAFQGLNLFSSDGPVEDTTTAVGGKRKFNMNQLLEHKNKKPRTHRNLSTKNKKSKVFYNRTKKNT